MSMCSAALRPVSDGQLAGPIRFVTLVSVDDVGDQPMTYDVTAVEGGEMNIVDPGEDFGCRTQTRTGPTR